MLKFKTNLDWAILTATKSEENQNKLSTLTGNKSLTKQFVQKLYTMYTKIIQNINFVYILYTKIAKIKLLQDNECTENVHQIPTYAQQCANCTELVQSSD